MIASSLPIHFAFALGPSFDCTKVETPATDLICHSPELSRIDLELVQAYYALRWQVGPSGWTALVQEDDDFLNNVAQTCKIPKSGPPLTDTAEAGACLGKTYQAQRAAWISRLSGAAIDEVNRPIEVHIVFQNYLKTLGFLPSTAPIDGVYGGATRTAIATWQRTRNLPDTGFIAKSEEQLLESSVASNVPAPPPLEGGNTEPPALTPTVNGNDPAADNRPVPLVGPAPSGSSTPPDEAFRNGLASFGKWAQSIGKQIQAAAETGPVTYVCTGLLDGKRMLVMADPNKKSVKVVTHFDGNFTADLMLEFVDGATGPIYKEENNDPNKISGLMNFLITIQKTGLDQPIAQSVDITNIHIKYGTIKGNQSLYSVIDRASGNMSLGDGAVNSKCTSTG